MSLYVSSSEQTKRKWFKQQQKGQLFADEIRRTIGMRSNRAVTAEEFDDGMSREAMVSFPDVSHLLYNSNFLSTYVEEA